MIDQTDQQLADWATNNLPGISVLFGLPAEEAKGSVVSFTLLQVVPEATARSVRDPAPFKLKLGYLVTTAASEFKEAHRLLGALAFAAMEVPDWTVSALEGGPDWWQALGRAPRPAFLLWASALRERSVRRAPLVKQGLVLRHSPFRVLQGQVVGPNDLPIMGATVELPALQQATRTDHDGRFQFPAVPCEPPISALRVNARGRAKLITLERLPEADEPLRIQLNESEI